jgi:hypothetical protein
MVVSVVVVVDKNDGTGGIYPVLSTYYNCKSIKQAKKISIDYVKNIDPHTIIGSVCASKIQIPQEINPKSYLSKKK